MLSLIGRDCGISRRPPYIVAHLQMVLKALSEGVPVLGYIHWSLLDNFEWREAYDTRAKIGLYSVLLNKEEVALQAGGARLGPAPPICASIHSCFSSGQRAHV